MTTRQRACTLCLTALTLIPVGLGAQRGVDTLIQGAAPLAGRIGANGETCRYDEHDRGWSVPLRLVGGACPDSLPWVSLSALEMVRRGLAAMQQRLAAGDDSATADRAYKQTIDLVGDSLNRARGRQWLADNEPAIRRAFDAGFAAGARTADSLRQVMGFNAATTPSQKLSFGQRLAAALAQYSQRQHELDVARAAAPTITINGIQNNQVTGFTRQCLYTRMGSTEVHTISSAAICPLTWP